MAKAIYEIPRKSSDEAIARFWEILDKADEAGVNLTYSTSPVMVIEVNEWSTKTQKFVKSLGFPVPHFPKGT